MYVPHSFKEPDPASIRRFLQEHDFATLVSWDGNRPIASHVLLQLRDRDDTRLVLYGHMSRENPQWKTFDPHAEVLVIFSGPHAYVSASWYSVKSAPTWNYVNVHAYGLPRFVQDREELYRLLKSLVDRQERSAPEESRYTIESLPADLRESMMKSIVGFEIEVTSVEAAAKLSQNRNQKDYENIIEMLERRKDPGAPGT